jgi:hypothetical protein
MAFYRIACFVDYIFCGLLELVGRFARLTGVFKTSESI